MRTMQFDLYVSWRFPQSNMELVGAHKGVLECAVEKRFTCNTYPARLFICGVGI